MENVNPFCGCLSVNMIKMKDLWRLEKVKRMTPTYNLFIFLF